MSQTEEPNYFARVNTRVTALFKMRLRWACEQRERATARRVPEGEILSEMGIHLDPHPEEANGGPGRKQPKAEGRKKGAA